MDPLLTIRTSDWGSDAILDAVEAALDQGLPMRAIKDAIETSRRRTLERAGFRWDIEEEVEAMDGEEYEFKASGQYVVPMVPSEERSET